MKKNKHPEITIFKVVKIFAITLAVFTLLYAILAAAVVIMSIYDESGAKYIVTYTMSSIGSAGFAVYFLWQAFNVHNTYKEYERAAAIEAEARQKKNNRL